MATVSERLAVFSEDFQAIQQPYQQLRKAKPGQSITNANARITEVATQAGGRSDEALEPFDAWIVSQLLPVDWRDSHYPDYKPDVPSRKQLSRNVFAALSRVAERLDDGSTHVAVPSLYDVKLFPFNGSQDLVYETHNARYSDDDYSEVEPRKKGVFLRFTGGIGVHASERDSQLSYRISDGLTYRLPVFEKVKHIQHPSLNTFPRQVNPELDPESEKYTPPFVSLGSPEATRSVKEMGKVFKTDTERFGLRTAAYLGGCASWLTIEPPTKHFRDLMVGNLAGHATTLLTKGTNFDATKRAVRASMQTVSERLSNTPIVSDEVADWPFEHIHALLHGAGATISDIKKKVNKEVGATPRTMRQLAGKLAIQRGVEEFFAALEATVR